MKIIEVDEELYQFIAGNTQSIGESASDILRRLLHLSSGSVTTVADPLLDAQVAENNIAVVAATTEKSAVEKTKISVPKAVKKETPTQEVSVKVVQKQAEPKGTQTVEKLQELFASGEFQQESKAVVRFLSILSLLYRTNPAGFAQAAQALQGRTRLYFAQDEATLSAAGNHTKPKQIPETPYWVITNNNSGRKLLILEGAMTAMGLPQNIIDSLRRYFTAN